MPEIVCPNCQHRFEPTDAVRSEIEKDLRQKMTEWQKQKEAALKQKEDALEKSIAENESQLRQKLEAEKKKLQEQLESSLRKQIAGDFEVQLKLLQQQATDSSEKLNTARQKELAFLQRIQEVENKEKELDLQLQKMVMEEKAKLTESIRKEEEQKLQLKETEFKFKLKEMEEKVEQQKRLAEEMKRRAEQGSMQAQGEAMEIVLEELLQQSFPFDKIEEVAKGIRGADCVLTVRNRMGQECGRIMFESKRTQHFTNDWIEKLKTDMRSQGADVAVLVTQAFPKDMTHFGEKEGVWICGFGEVKPLVHILRDGLIKISAAMQSQENKGDKMTMLYSYLTSNEFAEQWKAIREGFLSMQKSIATERNAMEKLWKQREKQLEKVLLNAAHFQGSIEGIAGQEIHLNLLADFENDIEE